MRGRGRGVQYSILNEIWVFTLILQYIQYDDMTFFLVKKSQKRHQVRSITELCIQSLYIPKTLGTIVS